MTETESLNRTPLHDAHVAAGARMVPFAGYEMPVQYVGVREEHEAVRGNAGVFDVSHMGEIETNGPDAFAFLQRVLSNDVSKLKVGGAQYSVLCNETGGVIDDLFTYKLGEQRFLTVTNAANHERDLAWFQDQAVDFDVELIDRLNDFAMLAVQGPKARELVSQLVEGPAPGWLEGNEDADAELPGRFRCKGLQISGCNEPPLVCGTGYTGEDGVELLIAPGDAVAVWDGLLALGVAPVGLGARDTLRLEVCYHLYGNDLMEERGPIEAGLGWCCKEETDFIGSEAISMARASGTDQKLVAFALTGPGIARQGNLVVGGGEVTSGTLSPSLGYGIGMAYVPAGSTEVGTPIEIDVRGKVRQAEVRSRPLFAGGSA